MKEKERGKNETEKKKKKRSEKKKKKRSEKKKKRCVYCTGAGRQSFWLKVPASRLTADDFQG